MDDHHPAVRAVRAAHQAALMAGDAGYDDPGTGYFVFTAAALLEQDRCCGSNCRHCPYAPDVDRAPMRIVSLLPSATEIAFTLGLGRELHGVSFECDFPDEARIKPVVSGTALPSEGVLSAAQIDSAVASTIAAGQPIYRLDAEVIRTIGPDLIIAQDLCGVCAVPSGAVEEALAGLGCRAEVLSLDPSRLDDVISCVGQVGARTGTMELAQELMRELRARVAAVRRRVVGRARPRVLAIEWSDPPFNAGHWVPDMIDAAGGVPVLAPAGERSRRLDWPEIAAATIDVVLFMPCGYDLDAAAAEGTTLLHRPELAGAGQLWALHADAYFSRPGPRVVDGVELLAALLHPDVASPQRGGMAVRLR